MRLDCQQSFEHRHAGLFLAALVAIGAGILILRHRSWIERQVDKYLPAALNKRQAAIGLVALANAALFTKIAEDVVNRESTRFDRAVKRWFGGRKFPPWSEPASGLLQTHLCGNPHYTALRDSAPSN